MEDRCKYCGALEVNCAGQCLARTLVREFEDNERSVREAEVTRRERLQLDDCKMSRMNLHGVLAIETDLSDCQVGYDRTRRSTYFTVEGLEFQVIRPEGSVMVRSSIDPPQWRIVHNRLDIGRALLGVKSGND